ncbi:MAG: isopenicillin N synthase family oxygenase [Proteobacteria bacterium]|nr:isopenicillin N synthase family oxygenase [Pseudomonadota bacterium]
MATVPHLDLRRARDASGRLQLARELADALHRFGFATVSGHGIDPALVRRAYTLFEAFFALPEREKAESGGVPGGARGFTAFGVEHARDCPVPDLKEFFHVGRDGAARFGAPENLWPTRLPGLERVALALFRALEGVSLELLGLLGEAHGLPAKALAECARGGNHVLRALHYPPVRDGADGGALRAAPHEDINLITLLCEATDAGLEIQHDGQWVPVAAGPGRIVVDAGDMLTRLTNGHFPATTHRVVQPAEAAGRHRYSLPFFCHPRPETDLSALPAFVPEGEAPRFPPTTAGAFLAERLREIGLEA